LIANGTMTISPFAEFLDVASTAAKRNQRCILRIGVVSAKIEVIPSAGTESGQCSTYLSD
jgi:hypothetical protein